MYYSQPTNITTNYYERYRPLSVWSYRDYAKAPKWKKGFVTNCDKSKLDKKIANYEKAANLAGTSLRVEDDAYDCNGNLISSLSAVFIKDNDKKSLFWKHLDQLKAETKTSIYMEFPKPELALPKLCNCSIMLLLRAGCRCNGF